MAKKLLLLLLIGFLLFWLVQDPGGLADSVRAVAVLAWETGADLFEATLNFVRSL